LLLFTGNRYQTFQDDKRSVPAVLFCIFSFIFCVRAGNDLVIARW